MKVIKSLSQFPSDAKFTCYEESVRNRDLVRMLSRLVPSAEFHGYVDSIESRSDEYVVVSAPNWRSLTAGVTKQNTVLIVPYVDVVNWDQWTFGPKIIDSLMGQRPARLPFAAWREFLAQSPHGVLVQDKPGMTSINANLYFYGAQTEKQAAAKQIRHVLDNLSDDRSRRIYEMLINGHPFRVWQHYVNSVFNDVQYFDYTHFEQDAVVLNFGIDEGHEIPYLAPHLSERARVYCVDPFGFDHLSPYVKRVVEDSRGIFIERRLAVTNYAGICRLPVRHDQQAIGGALNMNAAASGLREIEVPCVTVDQFVADEQLSRVDYLKFDLEGGEEYIIDGMRTTIAQYRPQIAIAIYHTLKHLWTLPYQLMQLCEDYEFFVGHYSYVRYDSIFYAIPREKARPRPLADTRPLLKLDMDPELLRMHAASVAEDPLLQPFSPSPSGKDEILWLDNLRLNRALAALQPWSAGLDPAFRVRLAQELALATNEVVPLEPPPAHFAQQAAMLSANLHRDGLVVLGNWLSTQQVEDVHRFLQSQPCYIGHVPIYGDGVPRTVDALRQMTNHACYKLETVVAAPWLLEVALSQEVLSVVSGYLGCTPTLYAMNLMWSFPQKATDHPYTQTVHRDYDDFKFCSLFIFLTDVNDVADGSHYYVKGSHRWDGLQDIVYGVNQQMSRSVRADMSTPIQRLSIQSFFGYGQIDELTDRVFAQQITEVTGKAGTMFIADPYGLHKGRMPTRSDRLLFWARYGLCRNTSFYSEAARPLLPRSVAAGRLRDSTRDRFITRLLFA